MRKTAQKQSYVEESATGGANRVLQTCFQRLNLGRIGKHDSLRHENLHFFVHLLIECLLANGVWLEVVEIVKLFLRGFDLLLDLRL